MRTVVCGPSHKGQQCAEPDWLRKAVEPICRRRILPLWEGIRSPTRIWHVSRNAFGTSCPTLAQTQDSALETLTCRMSTTSVYAAAHICPHKRRASSTDQICQSKHGHIWQNMAFKRHLKTYIANKRRLSDGDGEHYFPSVVDTVPH